MLVCIKLKILLLSNAKYFAAPNRQACLSVGLAGRIFFLQFFLHTFVSCGFVLLPVVLVTSRLVAFLLIVACRAGVPTWYIKSQLKQVFQL
jgi:hypothetical protein